MKGAPDIAFLMPPRWRKKRLTIRDEGERDVAKREKKDELDNGRPHDNTMP